MENKVHYIKDDGLYYKKDGSKFLSKGLNCITIAYLFDTDTGAYITMKHGERDTVHFWVEELKSMLKAHGDFGYSMSEEMHMISGRFDVDDVNGAINGCQDSYHNLLSHKVSRSLCFA